MRVLLIFIFLVLAGGVFAQPQDTATAFEKGSGEEVKHYDFFYQQVTTGIDTALGAFTRFRPTEKSRVPFGFLGPMGSASYPLIYQPGLHSGAQLGFNQFDLYRKQVDSLEYFYGEFPFTDLYYVQGLHGTQLFRAQFGMSVLPELEFGFDYDVVSDNGFLRDRRHRQRGNYLDAYLRYQSKNGRHKTLMGYVLNDSKAQEIGGIDTSQNSLDEIFTSNRAPADAIVRFSASSRYSENIFYLHQRYLFGKMGRADTAGNRKLQPNGHELFYDLRYQTKKYTYLDGNPGDSYDQYLLSMDSTHDFTNANLWQHRAGWKHVPGDSTKNKLRLAAFASWDIWSVDQQGRLFALNDIAANGDIGIFLGKGFHLNAGGRYHIGDYGFGDWSLNGELTLLPLEQAQLKIDANLVRSTPSFVSQHYLSNHFYWQQEDQQDKQTYTSLGGMLNLVPIHLSAGAQWSVTDNIVYFGSNGLPVQHDPAFSVWKFWLSHHLEIGKFNMDTRAWFQLFPTDAPLNLPTFVSRHRLYFNVELFEARVPTHVGVEVYYHTQYGFPSYQPVTGQFLITYNAGRNTYPVVEPYISMKIKSARLFFKVTNADQFYPFQNSYYFAEDYPIAPVAFAFGVSWRFYN